MVKMNETRWARLKRSIRSITFETLKVHLVLLSVCLVFSVFYILGKVALRSMHPFVFLTYRLFLATPILWVFALVLDRPKSLQLPQGWKEWLVLLLVGIFAVTINQSLFLVGLELSTASNAAITQPAIPIFSCLIGVVMGTEARTWLKFLGIGVSVVGAVLMIDFTHLVSDSSTGLQTLLGNLCFLGNTAAYSGFLVIQGPLFKRGYSAAKIMAWAFTFGTPPVVAIAAAIVPHKEWAETSVTNWLVLLYTAILATAFTFWASSWAVKKSDPTTVAVYLTVEPLATSILAAIFLHERLTILNYIGAIIIMAGVAVVMVSKHREKREEELNEYAKRKLVINTNTNNSNNNVEGSIVQSSQLKQILEGNQELKIVDSSNIYISPDLIKSNESTINHPIKMEQKKPKKDSKKKKEKKKKQNNSILSDIQYDDYFDDEESIGRYDEREDEEEEDY